MKNLRSALHASICVAASIAAFGCGSSSAHSQPSPNPSSTVVDDAGPVDATPPAASRTLKAGTLLSGSPRNLLLDPNFGGGGQASWGHFIAGFDPALDPVPLASRVFGASPGGVAAPVGVIKDPAATNDTSRTILLISSFVGGPGPYTAKVWVSGSNVAGEPIALNPNPNAVRVSITAVGRDAGKSVAYDLVRDDAAAVAFGTRTWVLFSAKITGALPAGGFFNIKLGKFGGGFQLAAPEIVPTALDTPSAKSFELGATARAMSADEHAAAATYSRLSRRLEGAGGHPKDPRYPAPPAL